MSKIVLASGNIGKLRELSQILSPLGLELIAQSDLNVAEAEETGLDGELKCLVALTCSMG